MRQCEEELKKIHQKMHVVNEIYKDLGEVVGEQQDQIGPRTRGRGGWISWRRQIDVAIKEVEIVLIQKKRIGRTNKVSSFS